MLEAITEDKDFLKEATVSQEGSSSNLKIPGKTLLCLKHFKFDIPNWSQNLIQSKT